MYKIIPSTYLTLKIIIGDCLTKGYDNDARTGERKFFHLNLLLFHRKLKNITRRKTWVFRSITKRLLE